MESELTGKGSKYIVRRTRGFKCMGEEKIELKQEWVTTTQATAFLKVSSKTMSRLIREGAVETIDHPLDRRKKMVRTSDLIKLKDAVEKIAA